MPAPPVTGILVFRKPECEVLDDLRPEIEHNVAVVVVADLRSIGGGQTANERQQGGRTGVPLGFGQRLVAGDGRAERLRARVLRDVPDEELLGFDPNAV